MPSARTKASNFYLQEIACPEQLEIWWSYWNLIIKRYTIRKAFDWLLADSILYIGKSDSEIKCVGTKIQHRYIL